MISGITSSSVGRLETPPQSGAVSGKNGPGFSAVLRNAMLPQNSESSLDDIFRTASERYHVPEGLLKAVAKVESDFQPDAVSCCGAEGIMQLMPSTASSLGVKNPFDPEQNIMGGAKYLGELLDSFGGDSALAVAAYNAGSGAVRKYGGVPPYRETQAYVKKVLGEAGEDIPVPSLSGGTSAESGSMGLTSLSSESESPASRPKAADAVLTSGFSAASADVMHGSLFARAYVQRLEQEAFELIVQANRVRKGEGEESV